MLQQKISYKPYPVQDFKHLLGLNGISDKTLEIHFKLYAGYVKNTNDLNEKIIELTEAGKSGSLEYAELKRRFGFEYNGMRLHEYYFGNMKPGGSELKESSPLGKLMTETYSSIEVWKNDFFKVGAMRGVGWAILFQDTLRPSTATSTGKKWKLAYSSRLAKPKLAQLRNTDQQSNKKGRGPKGLPPFCSGLLGHPK